MSRRIQCNLIRNRLLNLGKFQRSWWRLRRYPAWLVMICLKRIVFSVMAMAAGSEISWGFQCVWGRIGFWWRSRPVKHVSSAQHARQTCNMREEYFFLFVVYYRQWNSFLVTVATYLVITFFWSNLSPCYGCSLKHPLIREDLNVIQTSVPRD